MARYKRISKKKPITEKDEFIGFWERAYIWADENRSRLLLPLAGALVAVILVSGFIYYRAQSAISAQRELANALAAYPFPGQPEGVDHEKIKGALKAVSERFSGTGSARTADLYRADLFYKEGKYEDAVAIYKELMGKGVSGDVISGIAAVNLARSYEALGKNADAVGVLKKLRDASVPFAEEIDLMIARNYELSGDTKNAREEYGGFAEKHPASPYRERAGRKAAEL